MNCVFKTRNLYSKRGICIQNDDFRIQNDEIYRTQQLAENMYLLQGTYIMNYIYIYNELPIFRVIMGLNYVLMSPPPPPPEQVWLSR